LPRANDLPSYFWQLRTNFRVAIAILKDRLFRTLITDRLHGRKAVEHWPLPAERTSDRYINRSKIVFPQGQTQENVRKIQPMWIRITRIEPLLPLEANSICQCKVLNTSDVFV